MADTKKTKRLHISMAYTYVGDTGIDIPMELLEGKQRKNSWKLLVNMHRNTLMKFQLQITQNIFLTLIILKEKILILKITNSNTENNKADANKCVCLIYWKENAK